MQFVFPQTDQNENYPRVIFWWFWVTCPGTGISIMTFVREGSPKTVGVPKLTLPDLPACVGFYTLFDSAVCFVFCSSEIGLVKVKKWPAVWAPGCILTLLAGLQVPDALFWVSFPPKCLLLVVVNSIQEREALLQWISMQYVVCNPHRNVCPL